MSDGINMSGACALSWGGGHSLGGAGDLGSRPLRAATLIYIQNPNAFPRPLRYSP